MLEITCVLWLAAVGIQDDGFCGRVSDIDPDQPRITAHGSQIATSTPRASIPAGPTVNPNPETEIDILLPEGFERGRYGSYGDHRLDQARMFLGPSFLKEWLRSLRGWDVPSKYA